MWISEIIGGLAKNHDQILTIWLEVDMTTRITLKHASEKYDILLYSSCGSFQSLTFADRIVGLRYGNQCTNRPIECTNTKSKRKRLE